MNRIDVLLWVVLAYASITVFVVGHVWRYRNGQLTWTTRSTQLLESSRLRAGVILFHVGLLMVLGGHVLGIAVPKALTEAVGVTDHMYHVVAVSAGTLSGLIMLVGFALLMARRDTNPRVRATTTNIDRATYVLLLVMLLTGMYATVVVNIFGGGYDYRETVAPYFRGLFTLQPDIGLITGAPWAYKLHVVAAWLLYALWPFSRLVHAWSIPASYLTRSPILYRAAGPGAVARSRTHS